MSLNVTLRPSVHLRGSYDDESLCRGMVEVLLLVTLRDRASSLEYRTIDGQLRVAMLHEGVAHEFPSPPGEAAQWLLAANRDLLKDRVAADVHKPVVATLRVSEEAAVSSAWSSDTEFTWSILWNDTTTCCCETLLEEFWRRQRSKNVWYRWVLGLVRR